MKCPHCEKNGQKSSVEFVRNTTTMLAVRSFHDEEERQHYHNPNVSHKIYQCSNGHPITTDENVPCPVAECDWNKRPAP